MRTELLSFEIENYRSFCEVWQSVYDADYPVPFDTLCADARTSRK